jgi:RNA ligase partner protein
MLSRKFVIDTSVFVNPHARAKFGKTPMSAVTAFIRIVKKLDLQLYIPPSIFAELRNFIGSKKASELVLYVKKKAPNTYALYIPAAVLYDFIEDVRLRINKGLRLAEEFAKDNRPDNDPKLAKLRDKYRDSMRAGIVDSKEDFELILLAKELDAAVVTSDVGVIKFANKIGCETVDAERFHSLLKAMSKSQTGRTKAPRKTPTKSRAKKKK